jgi:hypothetical protein
MSHGTLDCDDERGPCRVPLRPRRERQRLMGRLVAFERSSALTASAADVWNHATTMAGVNAELAPWVRMTHPGGLNRLEDAPELIGQPVAFHSWLLAGGVVPFDRHALGLVSVERFDGGGGAFVEESSSWLQRRWRHEREVVVHGAGCRVTDRLLVEPRLAFNRPLVAKVVPWLFDRRHRVLSERFGT